MGKEDVKVPWRAVILGGSFTLIGGLAYVVAAIASGFYTSHWAGLVGSVVGGVSCLVGVAAGFAIDDMMENK
jgi:hypothetical protein